MSLEDVIAKIREEKMAAIAKYDRAIAALEDLTPGDGPLRALVSQRILLDEAGAVVDGKHRISAAAEVGVFGTRVRDALSRDEFTVSHKPLVGLQRRMFMAIPDGGRTANLTNLANKLSIKVDHAGQLLTILIRREKIRRVSQGMYTRVDGAQCF